VSSLSSMTGRGRGLLMTQAEDQARTRQATAEGVSFYHENAHRGHAPTQHGRIGLGRLQWALLPARIETKCDRRRPPAS
jgi:hypothetical protein